MYAPSQWVTALQCNAISHWLGAYTEWSLIFWHSHPLAAILTLNMLKCNKLQRYIHILNDFLDLVWHRQMKFTLEQNYMLPVLHRQYQACCRNSDFRSQGISRHGIDLISQNILSSASEELTEKLFSNTNSRISGAYIILQQTNPLVGSKCTRHITDPRLLLGIP